MTNLFAPLGRLLISSIFLLSGIHKIFNYENTQGYMAQFGVPGDLLPVVIALEILAPVAVILGLYARSASFLLAGFCLLAAGLFHNNLEDQMQFIMFMKNIALAGGLLMITANGPGALSMQK